MSKILSTFGGTGSAIIFGDVDIEPSEPSSGFGEVPPNYIPPNLVFNADFTGNQVQDITFNAVTGKFQITETDGDTRDVEALDGLVKKTDVDFDYTADFEALLN